MQQVFKPGCPNSRDFIAEAGGGKSYAAESYVINGSVISLAAKSSLTKDTEQRFSKSKRVICRTQETPALLMGTGERNTR